MTPSFGGNQSVTTLMDYHPIYDEDILIKILAPYLTLLKGDIASGGMALGALVI